MGLKHRISKDVYTDWKNGKAHEVGRRTADFDEDSPNDWYGCAVMYYDGIAEKDGSYEADVEVFSLASTPDMFKNIRHKAFLRVGKAGLVYDDITSSDWGGWDDYSDEEIDNNIMNRCFDEGGRLDSSNCYDKNIYIAVPGAFCPSGTDDLSDREKHVIDCINRKVIDHTVNSMCAYAKDHYDYLRTMSDTKDYFTGDVTVGGLLYDKFSNGEENIHLPADEVQDVIAKHSDYILSPSDLVYSQENGRHQTEMRWTDEGREILNRISDGFNNGHERSCTDVMDNILDNRVEYPHTLYRVVFDDGMRRSVSVCGPVEDADIPSDDPRYDSGISPVKESLYFNGLINTASDILRYAKDYSALTGGDCHIIPVNKDNCDDLKEDVFASDHLDEAVVSYKNEYAYCPAGCDDKRAVINEYNMLMVQAVFSIPDIRDFYSDYSNVTKNRYIIDNKGVVTPDIDMHTRGYVPLGGELAYADEDVKDALKRSCETTDRRCLLSGCTADMFGLHEIDDESNNAYTGPFTYDDDDERFCQGVVTHEAIRARDFLCIHSPDQVRPYIEKYYGSNALDGCDRYLLKSSSIVKPDTKDGKAVKVGGKPVYRLTENGNDLVKSVYPEAGFAYSNPDKIREVVTKILNDQGSLQKTSSKTKNIDDLPDFCKDTANLDLEF